ncbi:MAG: fimbria/pilus periplasmic chaperone [Gammaproteobacteria bacterium]|nr:fimbria/pilus periplasmic chaperone [Gammaproteobacteria bacterium]
MSSKMKINSAVFLAVLITSFLSSVAMAINVMPFSGELDLTKKPNYKVQVGNRSDFEAAVKISVQKWKIDIDGVEIREPTNDLIVFPKRLLLKPKSDRSVRVSYRNGVPPRVEASYRIIVEEVPMAKEKNQRRDKGASIKVLTRYVTSFYVKPRNALSEVKFIESSSQENGFQLRVRNEGNAHTHFISPSVTIRQGGKKLIITDLELLKPFTNTNLLALSDRIYDWEVPESLRGTLKFDQPYKVTLDWVCENCLKKTEQISFLVE